jgi:hypothetical protein
MDLMLLRIYQRQVVIACQAVLLGLNDIQTGLQTPGPNGPQTDHARVWYGVQNFIIGAGNVSKTLWGTGRNQTEADARQARRKPLRDSLGITDASPLRRIKIRNDYEHLDERIEQWWNESTNHNFVDSLIGPRGSIGGDAIDQNKDILRWLDPSTGDVIFWGNELNIPIVVTEVQLLLPTAQAEADKPHWEPPEAVQ